MKNKKSTDLLKQKKKAGRVLISMYTGTSVHRPKKGKGSYVRANKVRP